MEFNHEPVLLSEVIKMLEIKPEGTYVDATIGGGGHSFEIAKRLTGKGMLVGFDRDDDAVKASGERLRDFSNVTIVHSNYSYVKEELIKLGVNGADGILLDLGVSSHQLDAADRGFSYKYEAPLDMRMDRRDTRTAGDIVNNYSQGELFRIIRDYGEEKFAANIARHIVENRQNKPIETTTELAEIIKNAIPMKVRKTPGHPAKQTFQALRIELNDELNVLTDTLNEMIDLLKPHGRICVITFHSLEDRIVKNIFREAENPCKCPKNMPCVCGRIPKGKVCTKKPMIPTDSEIENNPRAKSAKLRVFEKA